MKKHNEGYALVLVLVVITVLCLVAMAMMAGSLKNLQNQQDSIERMEAKYAAQGEIEKSIAALNQVIKEDGSTVIVTELKRQLPSISESAFSYKTPSDGEPYILLTLSELYQKEETDNGTREYTIECKIRITGAITQNADDYNIEMPRWEYVSYTVTEGGDGS